jgi:hypothetical protein
MFGSSDGGCKQHTPGEIVKKRVEIWSGMDRAQRPGASYGLVHYEAWCAWCRAYFKGELRLDLAGYLAYESPRPEPKSDRAEKPEF